MKNKYLIIALAVIAAIILSTLIWKNSGSDDHAEHADHEEKSHTQEKHDEHSGEETKDTHEKEETGDEHAEEAIRLSDGELKEFGIKLEIAKAGILSKYIELPGEVILNSDRIAHVTPRVTGVVREVLVSLGDNVKKGQLLAILDSRELAEAKALYYAAIEREKVVVANFKREEMLWEKKVTSELEYLNATQALAEARIAKNSSEQQLHAIGFSDDELKNIPEHPNANYTQFELRAPLSGVISEKHLTLGENINADATVFTIANVSTVWVDVTIYQKDLAYISKGQSVEIEITNGIPLAKGKIAWISSTLDVGTRTAKARIDLPNKDGTLRPGQFVTAKVTIENSPVPCMVSKEAVQTIEGKTMIFIQDKDGLEAKTVKIGEQNEKSVEILSGIEVGQTYVSTGSFTLKAQLSKGAFGDGHNH